jgi:phosphatidylglycerol:prolipoprotein diacylglycerol transferase
MINSEYVHKIWSLCRRPAEKSLCGEQRLNLDSLLLGLSAALGLAWAAWLSPAGQELRRVDHGLWVLAASLVGGRVGYVAFNWGYYRQQPWQIPAVYLGGLSWPGALCGGLLALALLARLTRQSFGQLADALLPLLAGLSCGAWLACWLNGCAYGPLTSAFWGLPARDEWGSLERRWPTQLLGALLALSWVGLLIWARGRFTGLSRPGCTAALGLLGLAIQLGGLAFLRADPLPGWCQVRLDAWAAAGLGLAALAGLLISLLQPGPLAQQPVDRQDPSTEG